MNLENSPSGASWKKVGIREHHGIDVPLFSLHTKQSCGVGEILDLIPLIDWCVSIQMDTIQLLPINDSGHDPSPYNALSSCALHPLYLSLHSLPFLDEYPFLKEEIEKLRTTADTPHFNYEVVLQKKMGWLRIYFEKTGTAFVKSPEFLDFVSKNPWVESYGLFKTLREKFKYDSWQNWPQEFKKPGTQEYTLLVTEYWEELCFYALLQYLAFLQLTEVKKYAADKGVLLMGDIPILISPDSADVWHESRFFDLELVGGAPPDFYINEGQKWGFPLFNWDEMEKDGYSWWKQRLKWASNFFDLYRIDHAVGFFRIWGIPTDKAPREGRFVPENESLWGPLGEKRLRMMIDAAPMLPIAEDLGTIPFVTRATLLELGICGTKVLRWERKWNEDESFIPIEDYPALSMTTVSTHDSETLAQWWKDTPNEAKAFADFKKWHYTSVLTREQRWQILWDSHHTPSLFHVNLLQEYLAYFPELVWESCGDERINVPGKLLPTNWTYRFRHNLEEIMAHEGLRQLMQGIHA